MTRAVLLGRLNLAAIHQMNSYGNTAGPLFCFYRLLPSNRLCRFVFNILAPIPIYTLTLLFVLTSVLAI